MKDYESTEIAYKNGYAQGKKDALASRLIRLPKCLRNYLERNALATITALMNGCLCCVSMRIHALT